MLADFFLTQALFPMQNISKVRNVKKTKFMLFSNSNSSIGTNNLKIGNQIIIDQTGTNCKEKYFKFVGHVLDDKLSWEGHIEHIA